jgi:PIN domain nuclease of toxin-antitoxin system
VRTLLDTHTFIWFIEGKPLLRARARELIETPQTDLVLSVASLWEAAIKFSIGKLTLSQQFDILIPAALRANDIPLLDITFDHVARLTTLPFHHRDPFDRMLIAQAMTETLPIVSIDTIFDAYGVARIW